MQQLKVNWFNFLVLWLLRCTALAKRPATFEKRVKGLVSKLPELEFLAPVLHLSTVWILTTLFTFLFPPARLSRDETLLSTDSSGNSSDNGCTSPVDMIKRPNVFRHDRQSSTERWEQVYSIKFTVTEALFIYENEMEGGNNDSTLFPPSECCHWGWHVRLVRAVSEGVCKQRFGWLIDGRIGGSILHRSGFRHEHSRATTSLCWRYTSLLM